MPDSTKHRSDTAGRMAPRQRRHLARAAVPLLVATLGSAALVSGPAVAGTGAAKGDQVRVATKEVTASTTITQIRDGRYTLVTAGKIVPPPTCAEGTRPVEGGSCVAPASRGVCSGKVTVRAISGGRTVATRRAGVKPDCTYQSKMSIKIDCHITWPPLVIDCHITMLTRFAGNRDLHAKAALPQSSVGI